LLIHRFIRKSCGPLLVASALLFTMLCPGTAAASDEDFIKEIKQKYDQLEQAETDIYKQTLDFRTKEFDSLLQQASAQKKTLEQTVKADQDYLENIFEEDLKLMESKAGKDSKYKSKMREYEQQSDMSYSSGAMWKYEKSANPNYSSGAHWAFSNQINPNYSSGAMWSYHNNVNPDYSSSIMWRYENTVNPSYSSSTMWSLSNEANPSYSSSTMWKYKDGRLTKAEAQAKMDVIFAEGQASLEKTRQETKTKLDELRDDTVKRVTEERDDAVKTILDNRNDAVTKLMALRKELLGEAVTIKPLTLQFEPLVIHVDGTNSVVPTVPTAPNGNGIKVMIDGEVQSFEQSPVMMNGNTLVPMRAIFERLGAEMKWNATERSVTATKGEIKVYLKLGSKEALIGQKTIQLPIAAQLVSSNTMVPLRFVSEALGAEVKWEAAAQTVVITTVKDAA